MLSERLWRTSKGKLGDLGNCQDLQSWPDFVHFWSLPSPGPLESSCLQSDWPPCHPHQDLFLIFLCPLHMTFLPEASPSWAPAPPLLLGQCVCIRHREHACSSSAQLKISLVLRRGTSFTVLSLEADSLEVRHKRKRGGKDGTLVIG